MQSYYVQIIHDIHLLIEKKKSRDSQTPHSCWQVTSNLGCSTDRPVQRIYWVSLHLPPRCVIANLMSVVLSLASVHAA